MANQRFKAIPLGFLNDAQDSINVKDFEAVELDALDSDRLALGELAVSQYHTLAQATTPDLTVAEVAKTSFRLNPTTEEVEYLSVNDVWLSFKSTFEFKSNYLGDVDVGLYDGMVGRVSITDDNASTPGTIAIRQGAGGSLTVSTGALVLWQVTGYTPGVQLDYQFNFNGGPTTTGSITAPLPSSIDWFTAGVPGVEFKIDFSTLVVNDAIFFSLDSSLHSDGDYSYRVVQKAKETGDGWLVSASSDITAKNSGAVPSLAPSDPIPLGLINLDQAGSILNNFTPYLDSPDPSLPNTNPWKYLYYRRDPGQGSYFLVKDPFIKFDRTEDVVGRRLELDNVSLVEMETLQELSVLDESETDVNVAIGNPDCKYTMIFERNNRLFRVPKDRPDLLLYSRAVEWWGWQRENSFAFDGPIKAFAEIRDASTIGGELTLVIFTDKSIYHLNGVGTENNPYTLTRQITGVEAEPNSVVNTNGIIMFVSRSSDNGYNTGEFGQKVYEYNLQNLREVSARVQRNAIMLSSAVVEYAEMLGGDKYMFKRVGETSALIYHRDAEGWVEADSASETSNIWTWRSKTFTNTDMERFKVGYARKFKVDFVGNLAITFTVTYAQGGNSQTFVANLTAGTRQEITHQLPHIKGTTWDFKIVGTNATLYKMYLAG